MIAIDAILCKTENTILLSYLTTISFNHITIQYIHDMRQSIIEYHMKRRQDVDEPFEAPSGEPALESEGRQYRGSHSTYKLSTLDI